MLHRLSIVPAAESLAKFFARSVVSLRVHHHLIRVWIVHRESLVIDDVSFISINIFAALSNHINHRNERQPILAAHPRRSRVRHRPRPPQRVQRSRRFPDENIRVNVKHSHA